MNKLALVFCLYCGVAAAGDDEVPVGTLSLIVGPTPTGWVDPKADAIPCHVYRELCDALYGDGGVAEIDLTKALPDPPGGLGHWILKAY